jgi:3-oxoacyl-[acyl-carrier-protein] synthase-3
MRSLIVGTGSYAPAKKLTNADLEKIVETNDEWIVERTGIRERRMAAPEEATSDLAFEASKKALAMAQVDAADLDLIVMGTVTPDIPWPASAAILQGRLGNKKAFAFDVSAACAGSIYALSIADRYVASGAAKKALVIGADTLTRIVNWKDRNTCVLFGDGAGAMVLQPTDDPKRGIQSLHLHTDGSQWGILHQPAPGSRRPLSAEVLEKGEHHLFMNGREVYRFAVRALEDACREALAANHLSAGDITYVIAHQANKRILDATLDRLAVPASKCWMNLEKYGNTSSASVPTTLDEANRAGWFKPGDTILVMAIGAGMAWGAGIIRW